MRTWEKYYKLNTKKERERLKRNKNTDTAYLWSTWRLVLSVIGVVIYIITIVVHQFICLFDSFGFHLCVQCTRRQRVDCLLKWKQDKKEPGTTTITNPSSNHRLDMNICVWRSSQCVWFLMCLTDIHLD